jgi:hypothetical protein
MPAETHATTEPIDARDVLDLLDALVGDSAVTLEPDTLLTEVGLGDDLALLHVWGAATEEFAERSVADVDVEDLLLARTVGELADSIVRGLTGRAASGS